LSPLLLSLVFGAGLVFDVFAADGGDAPLPLPPFLLFAAAGGVTTSRDALEFLVALSLEALDELLLEVDESRDILAGFSLEPLDILALEPPPPLLLAAAAADDSTEVLDELGGGGGGVSLSASSHKCNPDSSKISTAASRDPLDASSTANMT
jgi:hypothetical protein